MNKFISIEDNYPNLIKEWHRTKNGEILPTMVSKGCHQRIWWMCEFGHEWNSVLKSRTLLNRNCPFCSKYGQKTTKNDSLASKRPDVMKEWDFDKNKGLSPFECRQFSNKIVWWKCSKNHSYQNSISHKSYRGDKCPFCNGILLKNGILCDSKSEAIKYLEYEMGKQPFEYHKKYPNWGRKTCDFYFPNENKYIEITSYDKSTTTVSGFYFSYLRKIVLKKKYVENELKATFEFIQFNPTQKQFKMLLENMA